MKRRVLSAKKIPLGTKVMVVHGTMPARGSDLGPTVGQEGRERLEIAFIATFY